MATKITIGGDFCITPQYVTNNLISDEVISLFRNSDINIVNLECPVVNQKHFEKISKTGPHLYTTEEVFKTLNRININAVTLANNHILDFGERGLINTINECKNRNIKTVGAGNNLQNSSLPTFIDHEGLRIALVNFCENEWSIATTDAAGANPLDLINNLQQIKFASKNAEFVLVIIHGGHEYFNLPSPRMIKVYRFFAENGADAIIGHHTHCISGFELYKNVPIFYGLGNMQFTKPKTLKSWYTGMIVQFKFEKSLPVKFEIHPTQQSSQDYELTLSTGSAKEETLAEIQKYSQILSNEEELKRHWEEFVQSKKSIINVFSPLKFIPGRYIRAGLKRLGLNRLLMKKSNLTQTLNHIRCEAHRDLVIELLRQRIIKG